MRTPETDYKIVATTLYRANLRMPTCVILRDLCNVAGYTAQEEKAFLEEWKRHSKANELSTGFEDVLDWYLLTADEMASVRGLKLFKFLSDKV